MAQIVMVEQYKTDLQSVIAQSKSLGQQIAITQNGEILAYVVPKQNKQKRKLNVGFLKEEYPDVKIPKNFDRMFEDEIAQIFYDENIETLNQTFV